MSQYRNVQYVWQQSVQMWSLHSLPQLVSPTQHTHTHTLWHPNPTQTHKYTVINPAHPPEIQTLLQTQVKDTATALFYVDSPQSRKRWVGSEVVHHVTATTQHNYCDRCHTQSGEAEWWGWADRRHKTQTLRTFSPTGAAHLVKLVLARQLCSQCQLTVDLQHPAPPILPM